MALLPIQKYFVYNDGLKPVSEFVPSENEGGIYEVLRVVDGVPLFLEDHLKRFRKSAEIAGKAIRFSSGQINSFLKLLIEKDEIDFGNILISCKTNLKAFFIAHKYPDVRQYSEGVSCGILHAERKNPNAKVFQTSVRQQANELIAKNDFYEVLLVDHGGFVTEGSRSNVFFIKGETIVTPTASKVLLGITRQKTIQCANELGYKVSEEDVSFSKLADFDAVFITGTSPKILPISIVGKLEFETQNEVLQNLIKQYDEMIKEHIKNARL